MDVIPSVASLREGHGSVGGVVFSDTSRLVAQVDPSGWLHAGVFLFHHELESVMKQLSWNILGGVLVITDSSGYCNLTTVA